jgi:hypothetical protein
VIGDGISVEKAAGLWVLEKNAAVAAVKGEVAAAAIEYGLAKW